MVGEFCTALDCVDAGFIPDGLLDALPAASQLGGTRVGGINVNKPRSRAVLAAALALAVAPGGFIRGPADGRAGRNRFRRPGGKQPDDPELPGLPARHQRT